jgi:hypothetical protein
MKAWSFGVCLVAAAAVGACGQGEGDGQGGSGGGPEASVTFHRDVEPLLHEHCLTCHSDGQIGGFSLEKYEDVKKLAPVIVTKTSAREMPPFSAKATPECQPRFSWRDDPSLTDDQIAMLKTWADEGAPEGDPKDAPPPFVLAPPGLANPDLEITAAEPTTVSGTEDKFVCVLYDPHLAETKYIDGIHFVAGNSNVAHHALLFQEKRADVTQLSGGASQFDCFGAPGSTLLNGWAPGAVPLELPAGVGMEIGPDDVVVIQMHYHPRGLTETDQSKLQLRFATSKPAWSYQTALIGNSSNAGEGLLPDPDDTNGVPEFRIPANAKHHVEEMVYTVPSALPIALPILAVGTHMHYVGTDMRLSIERKSPAADQPANECLVETPKWDFNWQRWYLYDTSIDSLPKVAPGDTLRMHCEYDNTKENPFVLKALQDQNLSEPKDVHLGETTLDEMCLGVVGILVPNL